EPADLRVFVDELFAVGSIPAGVTVLAGVVAVDRGERPLRPRCVAGGEQKQRAPGGTIQCLVPIRVAGRREALVELTHRVVPGACVRKNTKAYPTHATAPARTIALS